MSQPSIEPSTTLAELREILDRSEVDRAAIHLVRYEDGSRKVVVTLLGPLPTKGMGKAAADHGGTISGAIQRALDKYRSIR
jgi:hypothetical protein